MPARRAAATAPAVLAVFLLLTTAALAQAPAECTQPDACRALALEARERGQFERFHDLAWRVMQTGRPNDPDAMYLLARAQALSGRRRDALVILGRLADMGVPTDAATEEDLRRVRELAGWRAIEATFARLRASAAPPATPAPAAAPTASPAVTSPVTPPAAAAPAAGATAAPRTTIDARSGARGAAAPRALAPGTASAAAAPPPPPPPPAVIPVESRDASEVARFSADRFEAAGLEYDAVSRRFVFGDMRGRRLFVLGEGSTRTTDLVRADAAGFLDVESIAIDGRRGDLWVVTSGPDGTPGALHRLQLISGRPLTKFDPPAGAPAQLGDVAVSPNGTVLVLDRAGRRLLRLRRDAGELELALALDVDAPLSVAAESDQVAYVAHAAGLLRVDLAARRATAVGAPENLVLGKIERIRWHRNALVTVRETGTGHELMLVRLNRAGTAIAGVSLLAPSTQASSGPAPASLTVSGDDLYYSEVVTSSGSGDGGQVQVLVRRVELP